MPDFQNNLEELIDLLKKIKDKAIDNKIGEIDVSFLKDFNIVLDNYEMIKTAISPEIMQTLGEPMIGMINGLIQQLKSELNELVVQAQKNGTWDNADNDLARLNEMLMNPNLTSRQIDELLDKRSDIINKKQQQ